MNTQFDDITLLHVLDTSTKIGDFVPVVTSDVNFESTAADINDGTS